MLKKTTKKKNRSGDPKSTRNRLGKSYPVEQQQQARIKEAAVAGKTPLKTPSSMRVEFSPPPAKTTPKLLPAIAAAGSQKRSRKSATKPVLEVKVVNVSFALTRPGARQVSLCGEFNAWSTEAGPMIPHENGRWEAIVALRPGRYQYKFLVDGEWEPDPFVMETVPNEFGSLNSVIEVVAGSPNHSLEDCTLRANRGNRTDSGVASH